MAESEVEFQFDAPFDWRFIGFGAFMGFVNVVPNLLTRGAYGTDGFEVSGWPFTCFEMGGYSFRCEFYPWAMAANITIAVAASGLAAWVFRNGIWRTLRKLRTWRTPLAD